MRRRRVDSLLAGGRREALAALCTRHAVRRLGVFGSMLREDFEPARSDVDLAVSFAEPVAESLVEQYFDLQNELECLLGRSVDIVDIDAMPAARLKRLIERTQVIVYGE